MLVSLMSPEPSIAAAMNSLLQALTDVSNQSTVRHHELGRAEIIDDRDLVEFLFYQYNDAIRFALTRMEAERIRNSQAPVGSALSPRAA